MTPPPISRDGFARCPSCLTHVAVAADPRATVCPFCGGSFAAPTATVSRAGSSALVAALGLSLAMAGCNPKVEAGAEPAAPADRATNEERNPVQPAVYGGPPVREPPPEVERVPVDFELLLDPDTADTDADGGTTPTKEPAPSPETPPVAPAPPPLRPAPEPAPVYGGPPVREPRPRPQPRPPSPQDAPTPPPPEEPPASDDGGAAAGPGAGPIEIVPLYGVAPIEDRKRR